MHATAKAAFAMAALAVTLVGIAPMAAAEVVRPAKPVKQGTSTVPAPPPPGKTSEQPMVRAKQDPCADVHTYRTAQARAMCVAERGFPDIPDEE